MVSLDLLVMNQLMNLNLLHYYWSSQQTKELMRKLVLVKGHIIELYMEPKEMRMLILSQMIQ